MKNRQAVIVLSGVLALWRVISTVLNGFGVIDQARSLMQPDYWLYKVLFWSHLGDLMSGLGVLGLVTMLLTLTKETTASQPTPIPLSVRKDSHSIPTAATESMLVDRRIFVTQTAIELKEGCVGKTVYQLESQNKVFIGKWLRTTCVLANLSREDTVLFRGMRAVGTIANPSEPREKTYVVLVIEFPLRAESELSHLPIGRTIEVIGRLSGISVHSVNLQNAELVTP